MSENVRKENETNMNEKTIKCKSIQNCMESNVEKNDDCIKKEGTTGDAYSSFCDAIETTKKLKKNKYTKKSLCNQITSSPSSYAANEIKTTSTTTKAQEKNQRKKKIKSSQKTKKIIVRMMYGWHDNNNNNDDRHIDSS
jgi:hypothetical protein